MRNTVLILAMLAATCAGAATKITNDDRSNVMEVNTDGSLNAAVSGPTNSDGRVQTTVGDLHTESVDTYFLRSLSNFTLAQAVTNSGVDQTSLVYTVYATTGHGIAPADEILLLDVVADVEFYATVMAVATDTITVDRPIDHAFPTNSTLGRIVSSDMAVNGSVTEQIFTVRAGTRAIDFTRLIFQMTHSTAGDDSKFGGITALSRGVAFRVYNSFQKTIFDFKTNGDIRAFSYDLAYSDKAGGGLNGTGARISFGGQSKHGTVFRIADDDVLQFIIQDDLTGLSSFRATAQGHIAEQ